MIGYPEESDEVKAKRRLMRQAQEYVAHYLTGDGVGVYEDWVCEAAIAYAATQPRKRKRKMRAKR